MIAYIDTLASFLFPGRFVGGGKTVVCACTEYPVSDLSPCNFPLYFTHTLVYCGFAGVSSFNCMSCACCVEYPLAFALQKVGKGRLTLKKEQLSAIRSAYDQEDAFAWLP